MKSSVKEQDMSSPEDFIGKVVASVEVGIGGFTISFTDGSAYRVSTVTHDERKLEIMVTELRPSRSEL